MTALELAARRMVADAQAAGVAIGLRSPEVSLNAVAGYRTPDGEPMTLRTYHDLASITKILATTTSLIRLVSNGTIALDEAVSRYVPGFSGGAKDKVTIRLLLLHRGGLWQWQPLYAGGRSAERALRYAEQLPLRYSPDSVRRYSDLGFILLGRVIEAATSLPLDEAVRQLVTAPLGLRHTTYATPAGAEVAASAFGDATERAMVATGDPYPVLESAGFQRWRTDPIVGKVNDGNAFHAFAGVSGHAGLFSTMDDLLSFGSALADYTAHEQLWRPEVVRTFLTGGPDAEQALGFRSYFLDVDGITTTMYGHPGFVGCVVGFAPAARVALALCGNRLMTSGTPVPTNELWSAARRAASAELGKHTSKPQR